MPSGPPVLTSAHATGATAGFVTATPPQGVTATLYTFTATPTGGGAPITVTSPDPEARLPGLQPNTEVRKVW